MSSENILTVTKLIEFLPNSFQEMAIEHLKEYINTLREEKEWDDLVDKSQDKLTDFARKAKQEIAQGKAQLYELMS
ncbi:hypothetical protein ACN4EE_15940 [Geminocystis sp. CENA526]|uniref:hypothetical protein n=1 Tax=Geminocystis sp. CENA526 TaxID=1355871 RepID=UPI003D6FC224